MIPFTDKNKIQKAEVFEVKKYQGKTDGHGYMEIYPSVKCIYGHFIEDELAP